MEEKNKRNNKLFSRRDRNILIIIFCVLGIIQFLALVPFDFDATKAKGWVWAVITPSIIGILFFMGIIIEYIKAKFGYNEIIKSEKEEK